MSEFNREYVKKVDDDDLADTANIIIHHFSPEQKTEYFRDSDQTQLIFVLAAMTPSGRRHCYQYMDKELKHFCKDGLEEILHEKINILRDHKNAVSRFLAKISEQK